MRFKTAGVSFVLASFALMIVFQNCSKVNSRSVSQEPSSGTQATLTGDTVDEISLKLADDTVAAVDASEASISVQIDFEKKIVTIEQNGERKEINLTEANIQALRELLKLLGPVRLNPEVCTQVQNAIAASDIMFRKSNRDWQNLGAYRDCESHLDLPFQQKAALISLIWSIIDSKVERICPLLPLARPNCELLNQVEVPIYKNGCLVGISCQPKPATCDKERNMMAPRCPVGQILKPVLNEQKCVVGYNCENQKFPIVCPSIMAVMPNCIDNSSPIPVHDERGCQTGYRCEHGEAQTSGGMTQ